MIVRKLRLVGGLAAFGCLAFLIPVPKALTEETMQWRVIIACWAEHIGEFGRGLYELSESPSYVEDGIEKRMIRIRGCSSEDGFEKILEFKGDSLSIDFQALPLSVQGKHTDFLIGFLWEEPPQIYVLLLAEDQYESRMWISSINGPYVVGDPEFATWEVHLMPGTTVQCGESNDIVLSVEGPEVAVLDPRLCIRRLR